MTNAPARERVEDDDAVPVIVSECIGNGAPFPGVYDWTQGEAQDYIKAHRAAARDALRARASMDMKHASIVARMVSGSWRPRSVMDEYSWLWTSEERAQAKAARMMQTLEARTHGGHDNN